jgi:hypothetical protein
MYVCLPESRMDHDSPLCVTPHLTDGWPPGSRRTCQVRQMPGRYSIRAVGRAGVGDGGGGGWIPFWWVGLCWVGNCRLTGRSYWEMEMAGGDGYG